MAGNLRFSSSWDNVLTTQGDLENWDSQIQLCMAEIRRTRTGTALINAINAAPRIMVIVPDPGADINAETNFTNFSEAYPAGLKFVDQHLRPLPPTVGGGSCTIIKITPANYCYRSGVFSSADGGLFHEMCHGLHIMTGKLLADRNLNGGFDNMDEFFAITLTNIYMSEKGYPHMRRDHHGREKLDDALSTSAGFYQRWGPQVKEICFSAPALTNAIAMVEARFNPIRHYYKTVRH